MSIPKDKPKASGVQTITLTREAWKKFAPGCPPAWTEALFENIGLLTEHGILESEHRWCHFAATIYAETGNFRYLREDLFYVTPGALRKAWPSRFGHMSDAETKPFLRNPRGLANKVYNGRMGNRPGSSDGYDFRGGGWIQTTGRSSVEAYSRMLGIVPGPNTLDDPLITLQFAVLEWTAKDCNKWADENDIRKVAKAINTGSADSNVQPNGMSNRIAAFSGAWKYWGEYGEADTPAKPVTPKQIATVTAGTIAASQTVNAVVPTHWWTKIFDYIGLGGGGIDAQSLLSTGQTYGPQIKSVVTSGELLYVVAAIGIYIVIGHVMPKVFGGK